MPIYFQKCKMILPKGG